MSLRASARNYGMIRIRCGPHHWRGDRRECLWCNPIWTSGNVVGFFSMLRMTRPFLARSEWRRFSWIRPLPHLRKGNFNGFLLTFSVFYIPRPRFRHIFFQGCAMMALWDAGGRLPLLHRPPRRRYLSPESSPPAPQAARPESKKVGAGHPLRPRHR